jgi:hypothetical protein
MLARFHAEKRTQRLLIPDFSSFSNPTLGGVPPGGSHDLLNGERVAHASSPRV